MNSGRMERKEEALRIMEALSGVDQDLLARSEGLDGVAGTKQGQGREGKVLRFMNRHGRAMAACLCLAVLGAAYLMLELRLGNEMNDSAEKSGGAHCEDDVNNEPKFFLQAQERETEGEAERSAAELAEGECQADGWNGEDAMTDGEVNGIHAEDDKQFAVSPEMTQDGVANSEDFFPAQVPQEPEEHVLSLEEARAVEALGAYVPEALPDDCKFVGAVYEEKESGSRLVLTWTDGRQPIRLALSQTPFAEPEEAEGAGRAVYPADAAWEDVFWQPERDGKLQFAVLYGDGVLAEYEGCLGREGVLKMFGK